MKKLFLLGLAGVLLISCQEQQRYSQFSLEIETFKAVINDYDTKNWESYVSHYADTSKTRFNNVSMASSEIPNYHKGNDMNYSSRSFVEKGQEYEMVLDDERKTWVNFWGTWKGTLAANDKELTIPVHLTARFIDGKIVEDYGYWDPSEVLLSLQAIEAVNNLTIEEKEILNAINKVVVGWNAHDISNLKSMSSDKFTRTANGTIIANNIDEYEVFMKTFVTGFPDFAVKLDSYDIKGNKVYIDWTCTGTHNGDFMGNAPTGKKIVTHGFSIWSMNKDGQFTREDAFYDNLDLFNQLGITPPKA
jgi:steroid delta-isomerase-like uncharacterized protein